MGREVLRDSVRKSLVGQVEELGSCLKYKGSPLEASDVTGYMFLRRSL